MNIFAGTGLVAVAGGLLYVFAQPSAPDVYNMPVGTAYTQLANVDFGELTDGQKAAKIQYSARGNGKDKVFWTTRGSHVRVECELSLQPAPEAADSTHVTVTCNGGSASDGAASGIAHNMHRNTVIERLDAALTGRPFDRERAGQTAYRWPGDGVEGGYANAVGKAIEMDHEMRQQKAEWQKSAR
uniref:hypothetical protein n=1 Tax=Parerythrobacter lutipelagi TaxID=1964208 RepID=UPI0010F459C8|nr:hypothetical protein [Parerythrobacter lutipelagi]